MTDLLIEQSFTLDKDGQQQIEKLVKKILTFSHCPLTAKHAERMKIFADDKTVLFLSKILLTKSFPDTQDFNTSSMDIVTYFYCLALISYSEATETLNVLSLITEKMINEDYKNIDLFKRNFSFFKNREDFKALNIKLEEYLKAK